MKANVCKFANTAFGKYIPTKCSTFFHSPADLMGKNIQ
jgi:hypothetical protein